MFEKYKPFESRLAVEEEVKLYARNMPDGWVTWWNNAFNIVRSTAKLVVLVRL